MIRVSVKRFALWTLASFFALALTVAPVAHAQVLTGTLTGTVTDPTEAVVPNATVKVTDTGSGRQYIEKTNPEGVYTFTNLPNGTYRVVVESSGFSTTTVDRVQINVSLTSRINVRLEVAKTGTAVEVQAQQTTLQSDSAELKSTVDSAQLDALPLPTRNPLDLVKSFAGVLTPNVTSVTGGDAFVHGLRGNDTNLTQDGINVQDSTVKTSAFFAISSPVADTIEEINVSVGGIGTDGGFGAAQVSMVTKRGTNDYHGSLYWYQRTDALNANLWFNNAQGVKRPFQLQNRIGATIGGPASIPKLYNGKNKTFFFFSYQAYREPRAAATVRTVETTTAEQGLFTYTPTGGGSPTTVNLLNIGTIGNTGIKPVLNPTLSALYTGIVPQSGYTNVGCSNGDVTNVSCLSFPEKGVNNIDYYTFRIDQQIGSRNAFQMVFNRANYNTSPDFLNSNQPPFLDSPWSGGQISQRITWTGALNTTISPTQTNQVRFAYTYAPVGFIYGYNFADTGGNQVAYSTVTSPVMTSTNFSQGRDSPVTQYSDDYAWVKGQHQMRFGGEYRRNTATTFIDNRLYPVVTLGTNASNPDNLSVSTLPGISAAELNLANSVFVNDVGLLGSLAQGFNHTSPSSGYVPGVPESYNPEIQNFALYWQDSWKVRKNLTVQYGVRWEYQGPYNTQDGLILLPQNNLSGLFGPTASAGVPVGNLFAPGNISNQTDSILTLQGATNGKPITQRDLHNFGPFAGIAYTPFGDGKTVIRAHFAQHYVQDGLTFWETSTTGNTGLFSSFSNTTPTGVFATSGLPLPTPTAGTGGFPVSEVANWINSGGTSTEYNYDNHITTPYVLDWGAGIQRELIKKYTMEVRYVGNHAVKQYRGWSINELDINNNGVLQAFQNAQTNYNINVANGRTGTFAYNNLPGQVPTPLLDTLFAGLGTSSAYGSSTFITDLTQNNIYSMFNTIRTSPTYRTNVMGANGLGAANGLPLNFFVANPWATNAYNINNAGWSMYNGLEVEVKRQFSNGFFLLANYSFSKVLADTTFAESQSEIQNYQSLQNSKLDKFVAAINVRHSFGMTTSYPLPFGRGKMFGSGMNRLANAIVGGWVANGFTHWSTGAPLTINSNRFTMGSGISSTPVLENMSIKTLENNTGVYRTGNGVFFINPNLGLFTVKGNTSTANICTPGQTTPCFAEPAPGQMGNLPFDGFSGPHFFDQDFSLTKDTRLYERLTFRIALEAFDVFNNANFAYSTTAGTGNTSTDSTTFGQLSSTFDTARGGGVTSRIVQWSMKFIF